MHNKCKQFSNMTSMLNRTIIIETNHFRCMCVYVFVRQTKKKVEQYRMLGEYKYFFLECLKFDGTQRLFRTVFPVLEENPHVSNSSGQHSIYYWSPQLWMLVPLYSPRLVHHPSHEYWTMSMHAPIDWIGAKTSCEQRGVEVDFHLN